MPTPQELRVQAKDCLERANASDDYFVKVALKDMARRLNRDAHQAERRERDFSHFSMQAH